MDSINGFLTLERKDLKKFSSIQIRTLSIIEIITVFCTKLPPPGFLCEILYHDFTSLTQLPCRQKSQWYILLANSWTSYPILSIQYNCKNALPLVKKWPKKKMLRNELLYWDSKNLTKRLEEFEIQYYVVLCK